jgi:hypothetical protein
MATKTTVRVVFPKIDPSVPREVSHHLIQIYRALNNHALAFEKVATPAPPAAVRATTASGSAAIVTGVTSFNLATGKVAFFPGLGMVNNQSGATAYTVVATDSGKLILLNDAAAIAMALDSTLAAPWFTTIFNQGAGAATLTPTSGTINGGVSVLIPGGGFSIVYFDGTNWFAAGAPVQSPVYAYRAITAPTAITAADYQIEVTSGTFAQPLPTAVGIVGKVFSIKNSGTGSVTVSTTASQTIDGQLTQVLTQYDNMGVMSNGANYIIT